MLRRRAILFKRPPAVVAPGASSPSAPVQRGTNDNTNSATPPAMNITETPANSLGIIQIRFNATTTLTGISINGGANDIANWTVTHVTSADNSLILATKHLPAGMASGTIALTFAASTNSYYIYYTVSDANASTPISAGPTTANSSGTTLTATVTPASTADMVFVAAYHRSTNGTFTLDSGGVGFTGIKNENYSIGRIITAYKVPAGTTSPVTYTGISGGSDNWMTAAICIKGL